MQLYSNILGHGRPLVILHGFLGMSDNWKTLGKKFSKEGFEVHLVDQRNHGRSFHDSNFNYEVLVEDLKQYFEFHQIVDAIILGHSMGGKTAMLFATVFSELVSKLIVADISPRFYPIHHDTILDGLSSLNFSSLKSRGEADDILSRYVPDYGTRLFLLKNLFWVEKGVFGLRVNLPILKENVSEVGEALPMHSKYDKPTLFLRGDKSEYIAISDEMIIKQHFSSSEVVTISNSGHWLHAENPNDFYEAVIQFIA